MRNKSIQGLTLLEIMVVLFIVSITALMIFPMVSNETSIRTDIRIVSSILRYVFDTSTTTKQKCVLKIVFQEKTLSYNCQEEKRQFKINSLVSVNINSIGDVSEGELFIDFQPPSYENVTFLLSDGKHSHTVKLNGVSGKVKIIDE